MELPLRSQPIPAEVVAVRELRISASLEREAVMRDFYARFFFLEPWPPEPRLLGGWASGKRRRGIFFLHEHDPAIDAGRPRMHLLVPSLPELVQRLNDAEWPYTHWHGVGVAGDWLTVNDPVGHIIEVRQSTSLW